MKKIFNLMLIFCTLSLFAFAHAEDSDEKSDSPVDQNLGEVKSDCLEITDQSGDMNGSGLEDSEAGSNGSSGDAR